MRTDTGRIFTTPDGHQLNPGYLTKRFDRLTWHAGLPPIRLHDLRHGAATLHLAAGADLKVVQEMLGHSTITLTPTPTPASCRNSPAKPPTPPSP